VEVLRYQLFEIVDNFFFIEIKLNHLNIDFQIKYIKNSILINLNKIFHFTIILNYKPLKKSIKYII